METQRDQPVAVTVTTPGSSGRYKATQRLGEGGAGEVLSCTDRWIGRDVAWKRLKPNSVRNARARARFLREIRVQGQLEHPSIVPVYDVSRHEDGSVQFAMRRIRGTTLASS